MKKQLIFCLINFIFLNAEENKSINIEKRLQDLKSEDTSRLSVEEITYNLSIKEKPLKDLILEISKQKGINVFIPDDINIEDKVTLDYKKISISKAWNYLQKILSNLGYTLIKEAESYKLIKVETINKNQPISLYTDVPYEIIPNSEDYIRYLYYFSNINVTKRESSSYKNLEQILKDMLPGNVSNGYIIDPNTNSVIITGKAYNIKHIASLIEELDKSGFRENILIVPLYYAQASAVAKVLSNLIPTSKNEPFYGGSSSSTKLGYYFTENTKVSTIERSNSVIILGNKDAVYKIKDFIKKYLDKPLESGKSVIHVKKLQYIDSHDLAELLQKIFKSGDRSGSQSTSEKNIIDTLSRAIIAAEQPEPAPQPDTNSYGYNISNDANPSSSRPVIGGNNIIVAAEENDWKVIEQLVEELDQPQLQVALETLIVDLTIAQEKILGAQSRNFTDATAQQINWQTAQLSKPWLNFIPPGPDGNPNAINTVRGVAADLLQMTNPSNLGLSSSLNPVNIPLLASAGSTILSFNDGFGISNILQILDDYGNATVLSQPFGITKNHQSSKVELNQTRYVRGTVPQQSTGGPVVRPEEPIVASLSVTMTPRISRSENINLDITVNANDFITAELTNNTRNIRTISTNVNLGNKEVLVLGGLTRDVTTDFENDFPVISKIPIVGYLFKKRQRQITKNTLMIFIQPTIIQPKLGGGIDPYTQRKLDYTKEKELEFEAGLEGATFANLKDPITRWFFRPDAKEVNQEIDNYAKTGIFGKTNKLNCFNKPKIRPKCELKHLVENCENPFQK